MIEIMFQKYMNVAGIGIVVGGCLCGIVIIIDYVITSFLSMMKAR